PSLGAAVVVASQHDQLRLSPEGDAASGCPGRGSKHRTDERVRRALRAHRGRVRVARKDRGVVGKGEDPEERVARVLEARGSRTDGSPDGAAEETISREEPDVPDQEPALPRGVAAQRQDAHRDLPEPVLAILVEGRGAWNVRALEARREEAGAGAP